VTDTSESIKQGTFSVCGKRGMLVSTMATTAIYVVGLASMLVYAFYVSDHSPTLGFNHAVRGGRMRRWRPRRAVDNV
jgi:hypothetical protein